jgi:D-lactate dehydrogenase (cytochrome)
VATNAGVIASFLRDAAHVVGVAAGVVFPATEGDVAAAVAAASHVLPVGAQSSLTGGATPSGGLVLCTRRLTRIGPPAGGRIDVQAGVTISNLQAHLRTSNLYYPPGPTFDGASLGGTIATNAAGPATFKHGVTRDWVIAATVVLADGGVLDIERGQVVAEGGAFEVVQANGALIRVPVPTYDMPRVEKLSAGYFTAGAETDLIDLFIGSEGTLGIVTDATMRVVPRPKRLVALILCRDESQAIAVTKALRQATLLDRQTVDVAAIEYMDAASLREIHERVVTTIGMPVRDGATALLVQIELERENEESLVRLQAVLDECGITDEPFVAAPGDERAARSLFELREAVPAAVNARVAHAKATVDDQIEKTAADMIVPFDAVADSLRVYREELDRRSLAHAIWGHLSDGNLHPNVMPHSFDDVQRGREAILEIGRRIRRMGGAPLAEHGVGRSALKQQLLREMYGERGIDQMRAVKRALDPEWKLAPGVLFDRGSG